MIKLGDKVKDKISGFEGIVIGITNWLYGCERACVQPMELHDGKPIDSQTFDVPQLDLLEEGKVEGLPARRQSEPRYGPRPDPPRR